MASPRPSVLKRNREAQLLEKRQQKARRKAAQKAEKEARRAAGEPDPGPEIVPMERE